VPLANAMAVADSILFGRGLLLVDTAGHLDSLFCWGAQDGSAATSARLQRRARLPLAAVRLSRIPGTA
jgi:hypothetical protein